MRNSLFRLGCLLFLPLLFPAAPLPAAEALAISRGHVFLAADFEGPNPLTGWSGPGRLDTGPSGGHALLIERPAGSPDGSALAIRSLPVEQMRGCLVLVSARVRAENVSAKPLPYNGVKLMAPLETPDGKSWPAADTDVGTHDWRTVGFRLYVPPDAVRLSLVLGLERVTGRAWFDDIRVTLRRPPAVDAPAPPPGPAFKGHDLPRLRGAMVGPGIDEDGLRTFGRDWNANLVRWQLIRTGPVPDPLDLDAYDRWLRSAQAKLDAALPLCEKYGLRVVIDLHSPPGGKATSGGYAGSDHGLFTSARCQARFVEIWQEMARKYKDCRTVWGYDLANEPVESFGGEDLLDWQELAEKTARAVRAIDPDRAIIIEPAQWGGPAGFAQMQPIAVPGIVYSVHMYEPHAFTHQGVHSRDKPLTYPGVIAGRSWDKDRLAAVLKPVRDFQRRHNAHIYLGEFSAIRWAPGDSGARYLKDVIDLAEEYGWDWSYHAFREWDGWSVEHGPTREDRRPSATPTDRQQVLRSWFAKNRKPAPSPGLKYVWATAYHIPPETTTEESGYFSLCEGKNGKIYVGTAAYGRNAYLVEFDPKAETMRVVLDVHRLVGLPATPSGYAAQSKVHTRNFVGPSGLLYLGTKQGYPTAEEKKTGKIATYRGGYVLTYDPATGKATNLGMPLPLGDKRLPADATEGEGVIDVAADEARGLVYVITCEHQHWMLFDTKHPEKGYRDLGPVLRDQPNTLIDKKGRATAVTKDYEIARYDPGTDRVTVDPLVVDGRPFRDVAGKGAVHPDWRLAADGQTAYLQMLNDLRLFVVDLGGEAGRPVKARSLGNRVEGKGPDSRGSISIAPDGRVYSTVRVDNATGFGTGYLHHLVRYDPAAGTMTDLGVIAVKNPGFFDFKGPQAKNPDGSLRPRHGFHTLPDGTLTPLHVVMATLVAKDGTVWATTIYPFTLLRIPPLK